MRRSVLLLILLLGCAQTGFPVLAQQVSMQVSGLQAEYHPGDSGQIGFFLQLLDPGESVPAQGVWFLNIVEPLDVGNVRQVSQLLFATANEEPVAFRRAFSTAELEAGIEGGLTFSFRSNAPAGTYNLVLQLFEGGNTNPNRVKPGQRLAMKAWPFSIVP
jgi:hypothetical protein